MIKTLTITDFRNHGSSRVSAGGAKNIIITGANGSGKTSILEAISTLGTGSTMRGATTAEIARITGAGGFAVFAELSDGTEISVYWNGGAYRRAKINGETATLASIDSLLRTIWLTPREDRLFIDGASDRRAFFDKLAANLDPHHSGRAARLSKLLSERAFALKNGRDPLWLESLEKNISEMAVKVANGRINYINELNKYLAPYEYAVSINGILEEKIANGIAPDLTANEYAEYLSQNRELSGDKMLIDGPHKSDFRMFNAALAMPTEMTSTGQQKQALVTLIIAHAQLIRDRTGTNLIILLDEAAAHLDDENRGIMFARLNDANAQVWATGLDPELFRGIPSAQFITCIDGTVLIN